MLHLHPYCFSYAIIDRELNQIIDFEAKVLEQQHGKFLHNDSIAIWFADLQEIFNLPFKNSKVAIYSPEFAVLPNKTEKLAEIFKLLGFLKNEHITYLKKKISNLVYCSKAVQKYQTNFRFSCLIAKKKKFYLILSSNRH